MVDRNMPPGRRLGPIPDDRVLPPGLRSDSDLMQALTRLLERLQKPIGQPEKQKPLDTIGGIAGAARRRLDEPIGGAQTFPTSGGASAAGDIDEMRRQANRPPPSLDQPTPGGLAPSPLETGLNAAAPGVTRGMAGLSNAIAGLGGAVGGAFNYSPFAATPGAAGAPASADADELRRQAGRAAPTPAIPGAPGPTLEMAPSATGAPPGGANPRVDDIASGYAPRGLAAGGGAGGVAPLGGGAATDPFAAGGAFGRFAEGQNELMYRDPENAVRGAFRALGIEPDRNIYAQMTIDRYGKSLQSLAEVFQWVATGSPSTGGEQDNLMPQFLKHFMSGGDVRGLLSKAFDMAMAPGGEAMREGLGQLGAEQLQQMAAATSGVGRGTQRARAQLFEDAANRRAVAQMQNPNEADEFAWMEDMRKAYGF